MDLATLTAQWKQGWIADLQGAGVSAPAETVVQMARAAEAAGAVAVRVSSLQALSVLRPAVSLPVIGAIEKRYPDSSVLLTPTMAEVDALVANGADVIAVEGTDALRPGCQSAFRFIAGIKDRYPARLVLADVSNFNEAMNCAAAGADLVQMQPGPAPSAGKVDRCTWIAYLAQKCGAAVLAGVSWEAPEQAQAAYQAGALAIQVEVDPSLTAAQLELFRRAADNQKELTGRNVHNE